jgi:hypothetical protein
LGFDFRRVRSVRGRWRPQRTPKAKKRTGLLRELKEVFRRWRSQPVEKVIEVINPILRGRVDYFRIGNSAEYGITLRETRAVQRLPGPVPEPGLKSAPTPIGPITLGVKRTGERRTGKPFAPFDVAGAGNRPAGAGYRAGPRRNPTTLHVDTAIGRVLAVK